MQNKTFYNFSLHFITLFFRMFPFVSVLPSQRIVLRRWHRRRSRRNHDELGFSKLLHSISCTTSLQHLQHIIFYVTIALLFTVSQGKKFSRIVFLNSNLHFHCNIFYPLLAGIMYIFNVF